MKKFSKCHAPCPVWCNVVDCAGVRSGPLVPVALCIMCDI